MDGSYIIDDENKGIVRIMEKSMAKYIYNYKNLLSTIYSPPRCAETWKFEDLLGRDHIRYFSYGRNALAEGLVCTGIGPGDRVLVPDFICRDFLSSINSIGAVPVYYPVDMKLNLCVSVEDLPEGKAIVAVNYFGFPQELTPFREYCRRTGAVLIEDNAHGLFSRDYDGYFLGTRGDIGIFSLRKTVPMPDGAALVINNKKYLTGLKPQLDFSGCPEPLSFRVKQLLRKTVPWGGNVPIRLLTSTMRFIRKLKTGYEIIPSSAEAERNLPSDGNPCGRLLSHLGPVYVKGEVERRRELYKLVDSLLEEYPCQPVFDGLPDYVVPYGYPFRTDSSKIADIRLFMENNGLYCFPWPDLPSSVKDSIPEYHQNVWSVQFLW